MKRSAFTLIELLIVIAVITILATNLFPVFAQAREKARASACMNNEKQIGLGIIQYVQDYDEMYPARAQPVTDNAMDGLAPTRRRHRLTRAFVQAVR